MSNIKMKEQQLTIPAASSKWSLTYILFCTALQGDHTDVEKKQSSSMKYVGRGENDYTIKTCSTGS